ncbi:MAG TPA: DUF2075 domain-containing protein [Gemmataceae bacterium]|nr:DUF2075 domain-containing protein [Gemmataceae bacterium]
MEYGYRCSLGDFNRTSDSEKLGWLSTAAASIGFATQYTKQTGAWQAEIELLGRLATRLLAAIPQSRDWWLLLEYEIPRRGKRPDAVLLAEDLIFVIEFKVGATGFSGDAEWQVISYALDLRDFHLASQSRTILPVLVATAASHEDSPLLLDSLATANCVVRLQRTAGNGGADLAKCIASSYQTFHKHEARPIDAEAWASAAYRPCPGIIEAAEQLFAGHQVNDISHAFAHNLTATTDAIREAIDFSEATGTRTICFVTGIPGAGKTLAGLNSVHDPRLRSHGRPAAVFLSGNGPLVKIIRAALVMDRRRSGMNSKEASRTVSTFVSNVHGFLTKYGIKKPDEVPYENAIVFDEAQRAWDARAVEKKHRIAKSEPELVLEIMERSPKWCTVIALVGGGQEIHTGEAGLEAWGNALNARETSWRVMVSPEALHGGGAVAGHRLFDAPPRHHLTIAESPSLHLDVSVRSPRARRIGEWVNTIVSQEVAGQKETDSPSFEFPVVLTRDLETARRWLRSHADGSQRSGLLASSGALRLRAHGIEVSSAFRKGYSYVEWFLKGKEDSRTSSMLEVAATEFECQGLELDWTGICWGGDFLICPDTGQWRFQKFLGSKWRPVKQGKEKRYIANKYRVLLTRARRGMIIWVPHGDPRDPTRDPRSFDATAAFLQGQGLLTT